MSSVTDSLDMTFSYGGKLYEVTQSKSDFLTATSNALSNTGSARDLIKAMKSTLGLIGKTPWSWAAGMSKWATYQNFETYMNVTSIPRAPAAIIRASERISDVNAKGIQASGAYGLSKAGAAIFEALAMSSYATYCFLPQPKEGAVPVTSMEKFGDKLFFNARVLDTTWKVFAIASDGTDAYRFWNMYQAIDASTPDDATGVKAAKLSAINAEWRFAALRTAKSASAIFGACATLYFVKLVRCEVC